MVKSKKILCLILAVIILTAVSALCALGVSAVDIPISNCQLYRNQSSITSTSSTYPLSGTFNNSFAYLEVRISIAPGYSLFYNTDYFFTASFSCTYPLPSDVYLTYPIGNMTDNYIDSTTLEMVPTATGYDISFVFNRPSENSGTYTLLWFIFNYGSTISYTNVTFTLNSINISTDIPVPEPPEPPTIPSYAWSNALYEDKVLFCNAKLANSTWTEPNHYQDVSSPMLYLLPNPDHVYEFDLYGGSLVENAYEVFVDNVVLQGQISFFVKDQDIVDNFSLPAVTVTPYFAVSNEPSGDNFSPIAIPPLWYQQNRLVYNEHFLNGTLYTYTFYIACGSNFSQALGNVHPFQLVFFFNFSHSGALYIPNPIQYSLLGYNLNYYIPEDSEEELPPNPNNGLLSGLGPNTGVISGSVLQTDINSFDSEYANELAFLNSIYGVYGIDIDKWEKQVMALTNGISLDILETFDFLMASLQTDSIQFDIKFPGLVIPLPDANGTVSNTNAIRTQAVSIPFKEYIDAIPFAIKAILAASFVVGITLMFYFTAFTFIKQCFTGDLSNPLTKR